MRYAAAGLFLLLGQAAAVAQGTNSISSATVALNTTISLSRASTEANPFCTLRMAEPGDRPRVLVLASFTDKDLIIVDDPRLVGAAASSYVKMTFGVEGQTLELPVTEFDARFGRMAAYLPTDNSIEQYLIGWKQTSVALTPRNGTPVSASDTIFLGEPTDIATISMGWQSCIVGRNKYAGLAYDTFHDGVMRSLVEMQSGNALNARTATARPPAQPAAPVLPVAPPVAAAPAYSASGLPRRGPSTPYNDPEGARAAQARDDSRTRCEGEAIRGNQLPRGRGVTAQDMEEAQGRRREAMAECRRQFPDTGGFIGPQNLSRQAAPGQLSQQEQANLEELQARMEAQRRAIICNGIQVQPDYAGVRARTDCR